MIIIFNSSSYRNSYNDFKNDNFKAFWLGPDDIELEAVSNIRTFQPLRYSLTYSSTLYKAYKVYFDYKNIKLFVAENINELIKQIIDQKILVIYKLSYFYQILCPKEFLKVSEITEEI